MNISTTDARALFTKMLLEVYRERIRPQSFLRSFFPTKESATLELSIEVERGTEKIAVDVERGTDGNRNLWTRSTEKIFIPPYYREYFDITKLALYDRLFGSTDIESIVFSQLMEDVAEKIGMMQDKIERSYELQAANVLETGIVALNAGINIDFKRKAGSLVDKGAGAYWATGTVSPFDDLQNGATWLRQNGKSQGSMFNAIMGTTALQHFLNNTIVKERADIRNYSLDAIRAPQKNSVGASLHGVVSAGPYSVAIWSYPEYYDNSSSVSTPYVNPKKTIMLPEAPRFTLGFAAVPQLPTANGGTIKKGAYIVSDYIDEKKKTHEYHIESAGVAIPVAVDQIYTLQVVAS